MAHPEVVILIGRQEILEAVWIEDGSVEAIVGSQTMEGQTLSLVQGIAQFAEGVPEDGFLILA